VVVPTRPALAKLGFIAGLAVPLGSPAGFSEIVSPKKEIEWYHSSGVHGSDEVCYGVCIRTICSTPKQAEHMV